MGAPCPVALARQVASSATGGNQAAATLLTARFAGERHADPFGVDRHDPLPVRTAAGGATSH
jgi:hypothetical protein